MHILKLAQHLNCCVSCCCYSLTQISSKRRYYDGGDTWWSAADDEFYIASLIAKYAVCIHRQTLRKWHKVPHLIACLKR